MIRGSGRWDDISLNICSKVAPAMAEDPLCGSDHLPQTRISTPTSDIHTHIHTTKKKLKSYLTRVSLLFAGKTGTIIFFFFWSM